MAVILCRLGHGIVVCLAVLKVVRAWLPRVAVVASVPAVLEVAAASDTTSPSGRHRPRVAIRPAVLEVMRVAAASATTSHYGPPSSSEQETDEIVTTAQIRDASILIFPSSMEKKCSQRAYPHDHIQGNESKGAEAPLLALLHGGRVCFRHDAGKRGREIKHEGNRRKEMDTPETHLGFTYPHIRMSPFKKNPHEHNEATCL
jgi:hypothetical protein